MSQHSAKFVLRILLKPKKTNYASGSFQIAFQSGRILCFINPKLDVHGAAKQPDLRPPSGSTSPGPTASLWDALGTEGGTSNRAFWLFHFAPGTATYPPDPPESLREATAALSATVITP